MNYVFDDYTETWVCLVDLDQDEMEEFLTYSTGNCPYYKFMDDYVLARKQ